MAQPACVVIDDDRDTRESVGLLLRQQDIEFAGARSCEEGKRKVAALLPSFVILDLKMEADGLAMIRPLRELVPGLRVIVLTASDDRQAEAERECADTVITKGDAEALLRAIQTVPSAAAVLVVEEARQEFEDLCRALKRSGRSVTVADSGGRAKDYLTRGRFCACFLSGHLRDSDPLELAKTAHRTDGIHFVVVACSEEELARLATRGITGVRVALRSALGRAEELFVN